MYLRRTQHITKIFFILCCAGLTFYILLAFYTFHLSHLRYRIGNYIDEHNPNELDDLKYILIWSPNNNTVTDITDGQDLFIENLCPVVNCYITSNKYMLNNSYTNFDATIFNISVIENWNKDLPKYRTKNQIFVFYSIQSSDDYPLCDKRLDNYFNLTWTYKVNSDIFSPFIEVRDFEDNLIAPEEEVTWSTNKKLNYTDDVENHIKHKRKAMVWIVDKCNTRNSRFEFAKRLQSEFRINFLDFDIFGCGLFQCPEGNCYKLISRYYYFYFAAEESNSEDYVSREVLNAFNNYAVPVVMGGANYRLFLPDGSYIAIDPNSMENIVALIGYIIKSPTVYKNFHAWRKYYTIKETKPLNGICEMCAYLNNQRETRIRSGFRNWWYTKPLGKRCIPGGAEKYSEVLSYLNKSRHRL